MKLRRKTFAIISIAVISLVGTLLVVTRTMMMESVAEMEQKTTSQGINRVLDTLSQDLAQLDSTTRDYAAWDDTYAFVQDGNINYINLNLMDTTFVNLRLSLMLFINTSDQVVFGKAYDLNNMTGVSVPQSLLSRLGANDTLLHHESLNSSVVGTLLLPEGPLLVASRPILTSLGLGPMRGTLVTGRFLDSTELDFLFKTTRLPLVVQTIADSPISSDFQTANSSLSKKSPVFVQPLSNERIAGYALLEDLYGTPILILRTDMPRDFYAQSQTGILYAALFLIVAGVAFGLLTMLLFEKFVVSRLTRLSTKISEISRSGDLSVRVPETGKDELSSLGEGINRMLSTLGQTQEKRALSERELLIKDSAIASSIDGMAISDLQGNITYVNPAFVKMWRYDSNKEIFGKSIAEMTRKGQSKEKADEIVKALETKGGWTGEITATRKDGSKFYSILSASLVKDETGKPICMLGSFVDITDRKKGEENLKESEERLRQLIEYAPDAIYTNDLQGNFLEGNKRAEALTGFKKEELAGKNILKAGILPEKYAPKVMQDLMKNMRGQRTGPDEYELIRKDGTSVTAEISTFPVKREGKIEVIGIARDTTERKKAEKEKSRLLHDLHERAKELNCLYGMSRLFEKSDISLDDALQGTADLLPPAMQYPDITCARIVVENREFSTKNFKETRWKLQTDIKIFGKKAGSVEICHLEERPTIAEAPFLKEERHLMDAVAERLGKITERKKTEQASKESEETLRSIVENSSDQIFLLDRDCRFLSVNKTGADLFRMSPQEMVGRSMSEVFPETIATQFSKNVKNVIDTGKSMRIDEKMVVEGRELYSSSSLNPVKDDSGRVMAVTGIVRDITERKKTEKMLQDSEERFRAIFEGANDGILAADIETKKFSFANPRICEITGYSLEELLELGVGDIIPKKDLPYAIDSFEKQRQGKVALSKDIPVLRKDGRVVYCDVSSKPIKIGSQECLVGIFRDVTESKKAEEKLKESEEKLRNIIESSPDAITITDLRGIVVDCNQASVSLSGFSSKEELIGKTAFTLIAKKDYERAMENYKIAAEKGLLRNVSYTLIKKDGHECPAEFSTSALKDASGNLVCFVSVIRDVTERKQMQEKLEEYSQQLEKMVEHRTKQLEDAQQHLVKSERLATIGQVAAMVGHDLRNPLTGISGAAYYLKMKLGPNVEKKMLGMLEIIEKDIQYSSNIISDLMEYSKEIKLELTETTPKSIIAESISLLQIPEKVQLADSTLNEPRITIDFDKMKRVFANFIKNAVEAMPQGGKLTISSRASKGDVELTFADTGVGMAKEVLEKIWTPFFTTKAKGMGLGLAICRRIVEAHQGKIAVESTVGEGTTFTITIPFEPKQRAEGGEKVWVNMPESLLSTTTKA